MIALILGSYNTTEHFSRRYVFSQPLSLSNSFLDTDIRCAREQNNSQIGICMEFCEAGSLDTLCKKAGTHGWRTGEKVLGKIAESVRFVHKTRSFRSADTLRKTDDLGTRLPS